jgi:hypothetical protein
MSFTLKICQPVASIVMVRQFHKKRINLILIRFLTFGPTHSRSRREGGRWAQLLLCAAFSSEAELAALGWSCYLVAQHVCMTLEEKDSNRLPGNPTEKIVKKLVKLA